MKLMILICLTLIFGCQRQSSPKDEGHKSQALPPPVQTGEPAEPVRFALKLTWKDSVYVVEPSWVEGPFGTVDKESILRVKVNSESNIPLPEGTYLEFYAMMPNMGHPMDRAGYFVEVEPGVFENKTIAFQMPGEWKFYLYLVNEGNDDILSEVSWEFSF